ncbi:betaine-aldehyde dehydrogenase [Brevundimonas sp. LM2]|uniref:aldehyde dehydrogenase family protein n=1 Tax=Brevundimonas sp. LM2 TaxID=1938605 RepID=UPI000983A6EF|nr:aldehyde dehydrogenase family protein [Brevundimonas sp. LM2]AQR63068.1 betaine-aldehyde dehydrogenase [Brevundimonas sp. LM2]
MSHIEIDPALAALDIAKGFLSGGPKRLLIDGDWVAARSGETFEVINPTTEEVLAEVALADAADIDLAVEAAHRAFHDPHWANITPAARARYLLKIADLMDENIEELATLQSLEMGAVVRETRLMTSMMSDVFRYYAGWTTKMFGHTNPSDGSVFNYTLREPLGVVAAIIPWNGPILAATWKLAPALACGNTVVMKPAEVAPLVVLRLAELIQEAGVPAGVVNMVPGYGKGAGEALINHPLVAKLAFTGSTETGKHLMEVASRTMKKVGLELGGKSPTIVFDDADLDKAAALAAYGFAGNTGQMCVAGSRILVQDGVYDAFAAKLTAAVGAMAPGSPFHEASALGPLASKAQYDRVNGYLALAEQEGARRITPDRTLSDKGYFIAPTIYADVTPDMRIVREEIFGPVAVLIRFTDEADAVAKGNDTEFGLTATVWTAEAGRATRMARALKAGTVWVNTMFNLDAASPFGGYKSSGTGRELGPESIDAYTQIKSVYVGL